MFSIYTSAFNLVKHSFLWKGSLTNFSEFAGNDGEVIVAVNTSDDNTYEILTQWMPPINNVKIIKTDIPYSDIRFDGLVKDAALQACTKDLCIQMDLDEIFISEQKDLWRQTGRKMLESQNSCFCLPVLDLYGSVHTIKNSKNIGIKFRLHRNNMGFRRGVVKNAWNEDKSKFNTSISDSCELIYPDGSLVGGVFPFDSSFLLTDNVYYLQYVPIVIHKGYLDLSQRVNINTIFWKNHWEMRSGHEENVEIDKNKLDSVSVIKHNLPFKLEEKYFE